MNYLAHLLLSQDREDIMMGNFLADMLRKKEAMELPKEWHVGIDFHRKIDWYTDNHPSVKASMGLLYKRHHKYAPVLVDIFYDYILHQHWNDFSKESPIGFRQRCYSIIMQNWDNMPIKVQPSVKAMVEGDWLVSYTLKEGIKDSVRRVKKRVSRPDYLDNAVNSLEENYEEMESHFLAFFPDLLRELTPIIEKKLA